MDVTTLVIAVLGLAIGVASLAWQAASFVFEGARVQATLMVVWLSGESAIKALPGAWDWGRPPSPAYTVEALAIEVRNKGRGPTTIGSWGIRVGEHFLTAWEVPANPAVPYRLEGGAVQQWVIGLENIMDVARNLGGTRVSINGEVRLGTGKVVKSSNYLKVIGAGTEGARLEPHSFRRPRVSVPWRKYAV